MQIIIVVFTVIIAVLLIMLIASKVENDVKKSDLKFLTDQVERLKKEYNQLIQDSAKLNDLKNKQIDENHRQLLNFASEKNYYKKEHEKVCSALKGSIKDVELKSILLRKFESEKHHLIDQFSRLANAGAKIIQYKGKKPHELKKLQNEFMHIAGEPVRTPFQFEVVISKPMSSDELKAQTLST